MAAKGKTPLEPPAFDSLRLGTRWFDKWYKLKIDGFLFFPVVHKLKHDKSYREFGKTRL